MIDADWFKAYNDSHGHQAGDKLLAMIAACVSKNVRRPGDLSVRYGGEEFAALLPGTDLAGAVEVADGIRASVSALDIPHPTSASGFQTVSVGVASVIPCRGEHHRALVAAADMALYRAKNNGRNRTELAHVATAGLPAQSDSAARARRVA
jgi:diguanylate cyclase (GGDEF)-like protein